MQLSRASRTSSDPYASVYIVVQDPDRRILVGWSIIDRLHLVHVPTFVINGRKDISQDFVVAPFFKHIPKVKWVTLENSSHMPFWEERERFVQLVAGFLAL